MIYRSAVLTHPSSSFCAWWNLMVPLLPAQKGPLRLSSSNGSSITAYAISANTPCFKHFSLPVLGTTDSSAPLKKKHELAQASSLHPLGDGKCPKPTPIQIVGAPSRAGFHVGEDPPLQLWSRKKRPMISHQSIGKPNGPMGEPQWNL